MHLLRDCLTALKQGGIFLAMLFVAFFLAERAFSFSRGKKSRRDTWLDAQYALLALLYPPVINFVLAGFFASVASRIESPAVAGPVSISSFAGDLFMVLLMRDALIYLRHRVFHSRAVWDFHSIHHSSEELNWLSAVRFHPGESLIESTTEILLFLVCGLAGVDAKVLSVASLLIGAHNFFIHSNLRWTFGPLRYLFVSPVFHRWHHSDTRAAMNKNFAAMFSFIDLAFGTFYMPAKGMPQTLGLSAAEKESHPRTLAGQTLHPFRKFITRR